MATNAENAAAALANLWGRLAELDAVPLSQRARMNYTDDNGRSYGWSSFRDSILAAIEKIQGAGANGSSLIQQAGGPFTVYG